MSPIHTSSTPATGPSFASASDILGIELVDSGIQLLMAFHSPPAPGNVDTITTSPPESPQVLSLSLTCTQPHPAPSTSSTTTSTVASSQTVQTQVAVASGPSKKSESKSRRKSSSGQHFKDIDSDPRFCTVDRSAEAGPLGTSQMSTGPNTVKPTTTQSCCRLRLADWVREVSPPPPPPLKHLHTESQEDTTPPPAQAPRSSL